MIFIHLLLPVLYAALFAFSFPSQVLFVQFVIGVLLGFSIFFFDRVAHVFFIQPETEFSQLVQDSWRHRRFGEVIKLLLVAKTLQEQLITRSVLFLFIYVLLSLFVITSTGSVLGVGIILGLGLHFCLDLIMYRRDLHQFRKHFLWQMKKDLAEREVNIFIGLFLLFFLVLTLMVLL